MSTYDDDGIIRDHEFEPSPMVEDACIHDEGYGEICNAPQSSHQPEPGPGDRRG